MAGLYTVSVNSTKTISLGELDQLMDLAVGMKGGEMTPTQALTVPLCFRAIDMIAGAVSRMPYYIEDQAENDVTEDNTPRYWKELMYKLSASLLLYDSAYCLKESNEFGYNAQYRFLPSPLVNYQLNPVTNEIDYFTYQSGARLEYIRDFDKRLMWWWWPNLQSEVGPGIGPRDAAMGDVGLAWNLTKFAEMYFKRGGFPLTILSVEGNVPDSEKILSWWNSMIAGVRRAFRAILLTNKIDPKVIGSNIKDTIAPELFDQAATNVAIAFGIPISKFIDSLKYGNATVENDFTFLTDTVVPLANRIYEPWNERVYEPQGLKIEIWPEKLEAFQSYQLKQAQIIQPLVGKPIMSINEGREIVGMNRIENDPRADEVLPAEQPAQLQAATQPDAMTTDNNAAPDQSVTQETQDRDDAIENERKALKRYAHNRLRDGKPFIFHSGVISQYEIGLIEDCETHEDIDALDIGLCVSVAKKLMRDDPDGFLMAEFREGFRRSKKSQQSNAEKREYSANDIAALLERAIKTVEAMTP